MVPKVGAPAGLDLSLKKWREYQAAVEEMLDRTDHAAAPWVLVEAEDKRWARVKVAPGMSATPSMSPSR